MSVGRLTDRGITYNLIYLLRTNNYPKLLIKSVHTLHPFLQSSKLHLEYEMNINISREQS
jgi:hypothetical protein